MMMSNLNKTIRQERKSSLSSRRRRMAKRRKRRKKRKRKKWTQMTTQLQVLSSGTVSRTTCEAPTS